MNFYDVSSFGALKMALFMIILSQITLSISTLVPHSRIGCDENFDCPIGDVCDTDIEECVDGCQFRNSKGSPCARNAACSLSTSAHESNCWCDDGYAGDAYYQGCEEIKY